MNLDYTISSDMLSSDTSNIPSITAPKDQISFQVIYINCPLCFKVNKDVLLVINPNVDKLQFKMIKDIEFLFRVFHEFDGIFHIISVKYIVKDSVAFFDSIKDYESIHTAPNNVTSNIFTFTNINLVQI